MKIVNSLREVKDNRKNKGKKYPLHAILATIVVSLLCGHSRIKDAWHMLNDLHYKQKFMLGFKRHQYPSYPVFTQALQQLDIKTLEKTLSDIVNREDSVFEGANFTQLSVDGKSLSGRKNAQGSTYHLVSLFCNEVKSVFGQTLSNKGGGEIQAALDLIKNIDLTDKVITGDAMFANSKLCQEIVNKGGDYAFTLKSNQQELRHEMLQLLRLNPWPKRVKEYKEEVTKAHGRIEYRKIEVINNHYTHIKGGFSTIKQLARITRYRNELKYPGKGSNEIAYIITSLSESQASPEVLLKLNRNHWAIENNLHRTRDTLFAEDSATIRKKDAPQSVSALSNLAISLLNKAKSKDKYKNISMTALTKACARKVKIPLAMVC